MFLLTLNSDDMFEKKTDLLFQKWQEFAEFWPEHSKFSKFSLLLVPFVESVYHLTYKGTEELSFMTLKSDAKFEEKLACGLESDMRNMTRFHQSTQKSQNWNFDGIL